MAFTREPGRTPTSIGEIVIVLRDNVNPVDQKIEYQLRVLDALGKEVATQSGNLAPQLTQAQITQLQAFMAAMRTKAQTEILPQ
jgi:hypothetical protein